MKAAAVAALLPLIIGAGTSHAQSSDKQNFTHIERGRYLADLGDCFACHTAQDGKPFAGGRPIETPFGTIVSPNITPDRATGIGAWTAEKFYRAMHDGISGDERLYPAMPYPYYTKASRDDVLAIRAWLDTIAPLSNRVHSNQLPFPFDIRGGMAGWDKLYFESGEWRDRPDKPADWNRGGYLVEGLGHCGACHTLKNMFGADENSRHLQGYALQGWFAPDITNDAHTGLGSWSEQDIVEYLKTGTNAYATAAGPMAEEVGRGPWRRAMLRPDLPCPPSDGSCWTIRLRRLRRMSAMPGEMPRRRSLPAMLGERGKSWPHDKSDEVRASRRRCTASQCRGLGRQT